MASIHGVYKKSDKKSFGQTDFLDFTAKNIVQIVRFPFRSNKLYYSFAHTAWPPKNCERKNQTSLQNTTMSTSLGESGYS